MRVHGNIAEPCNPHRRNAVKMSAIALAVLATAATAPLAAQDDLEQRVRALERRLQLADGVEFRFKGLLQADARVFTGDGGTFNDTFLLRRVEPSFELTLGKLAYFKLLPQLAGDATVIADAFGELRFHPAATLRFGKFKEPLVLENLQSSGALTFIERGVPSEVGAARDYGIQLQGEAPGGTATYAVGWFNGAADGRDAASSDTDNRKEFAARLFLEPFKARPGFFEKLGVGVAGSSGRKLGAPNAATFNNTLPRYRSPGQQTVFSYRLAAVAPDLTNTVIAAGDHTRLAPQLYFYRNAFGVLGEYILSKQEVSLAGAAAELEHVAWQGVVSYVLTGEDAGYKGVKPATPYAAGAAGWGAVELALRYGTLDVDAAAFPTYANPDAAVSELNDLGIALNWYLTEHARIALNYDRTAFEGGAAGGADRADEKAVFARVQLSF
jgi:phosphate-selective porin OprO/OprP